MVHKLRRRLIASGNTETETANAKLQFATEIEKWKHQFGGAALYASSEPEGKTAQRWEAFEQTDYNFSPRTFWFGALRYEDDEFSGFEYQAIVSTGLGRKFIDTDVTKFTGTAGVGYKSFETRDAFDDAGVLALAVGYSVRHNTDPPVGFEKTDTLTTINLVYEIK